MPSRTTVVSLTLSLFVAFQAAAAAEIGPYIGGSIGQTRVELDPGDVPGAGFRIDDEDFAYKLFFGLELPGPLAVEVGYRELGEVTDDGTLVRTTAASDGLDAYLIGKLPLGPVQLFAKGGAIAWDTEVRTQAAPGVGVPDVRFSDDGTDFAWGLGVGFEIGRFSIRGEFEKFELDVPDDLVMLSVGLAFEF